MDADSRMIPGIATSWKAIDPTTWEFKLRKGVKFHDGSELTAEDVAFSIDRAAELTNSPGPVLRLHEGDRRQGDRRPVHDPLQDGGAVPAGAERPVDDLHRVEEGRDRRDDRGLQHRQGAVGSGRYKFVRYVNGDRVELVRNDNYWGESRPGTR